jgi:nucleotide-binding universal stress UspA family protein
MGRIVVGVDESSGAAAALRWAVREADKRSWSLTAVLAWGFLDQHHPVNGQPFDPTYGEADAAAALDAIVAAAVGSPDAAAAVERTVVNDLAARALLDVSADADLLVVGARGRGGFRGLLLGSVSQQSLHHATCPVAVVREGTVDAAERIGRIVVGIDGSDTSHRALQWALDAARVHDAAVDAVHAWTMPYGLGVGMGLGIVGAALDVTPVEDVARRTLDAAVDSADTSGLPGPVTRTMTYGSAAAALLETAEGADLVVVGSRGLGGFKGALLGSVSHNVAHRATCPVVVVPPAIE